MNKSGFLIEQIEDATIFTNFTDDMRLIGSVVGKTWRHKSRDVIFVGPGEYKIFQHSVCRFDLSQIQFRLFHTPKRTET